MNKTETKTIIEFLEKLKTQHKGSSEKRQFENTQTLGNGEEVNTVITLEIDGDVKTYEEVANNFDNSHYPNIQITYFNEKTIYIRFYHFTNEK